MIQRNRFAFALFAFVLCSIARAGEASATPAPRTVEYSWMSIARWNEMHAEDVAIANEGSSKLIFLGDSIIEGWERTESWKQRVAPFHPSNFGIGGDQTGNLLWRLQNGATGKLDPKVVVLLIGVNNFGHNNDTPEAVFSGVSAVITQIGTSFPNARILALSIFPFEEKPDHPNREKARKANAMINGLANTNIKVMDIGQELLEADGSISKEIMGDFLHPTPLGYKRATAAILPTIQKWMED